MYLRPNLLLGFDRPPVLPQRVVVPINWRYHHLADHPGRLHRAQLHLVPGIGWFIDRHVLLPRAVMSAIVPVWSVLVSEYRFVQAQQRYELFAW